LLEAQVFHQEAQIGIQRVKLLQLAVLLIGLDLKLACLDFLGSDFFLQLLDAVIKDEFKLLELLRLSLKEENFSFSIANLSIFLSDLLMKQCDVVVVLLLDLLLLLHGTLLVRNVTLETLHVVINVLHFVLDQLELSFGLEGHIVHLLLIARVFVRDGRQLIISVLLDLLNRHLVPLV